MKIKSPSRALCLLVAIFAFSTTVAVGDPLPPSEDFSPTPDLACLNGSDHPEAIQGRVPAADFLGDHPRAADGYTCNATQVFHIGSAQGGTGSSGGYRVYRYVDNHGRVCAFYDTTLLFPVNAKAGGTELTGVWVLSISEPGADPHAPIHTASLLAPGMQSPHESFSLNVARGLLGAVFANPAFYHGQFDLYDASEDCRTPQLKSSLPMGVLGHEGSFTPDGNTYYASSLYGHTLTAIDTSDTSLTKILWTSTNWNVHGMNLSDDGNLLYFADLAGNGAESLGTIAGSATKGLTILDVSEIQRVPRVINPQVGLDQVVSHLTWTRVGTPQTAIPITVGSTHYLVEIDEFGGVNNVGAARIINVQDPGHPAVVSNMRLAVNNTQDDPSQKLDPNATNSLGGYRGHYCSVPTEVNPKIVACSFILSGLRVFDISDLEHPVEIAYFNQPSTVPQPGTTVAYGAQGSYAMSQPAFDVANHQIWYSDGNSGFYAVHINDSVWPS